MTASDHCTALIKEFEGLRLESYQDAVGVWTVGYGTTRGAEPGQTITTEQAETFLRNDLQRVAGVLSASIKRAVSEHQFDACCCLAYNIGCGNFTRSTLLEKINEGDLVAAAAEFPKWNHAGGKVLAGLTRRRQAERDLFETP